MLHTRDIVLYSLFTYRLQVASYNAKNPVGGCLQATLFY